MTTVLRWIAGRRITGACPNLELLRTGDGVALFQPGGTRWQHADGTKGGPRGRNLLPQEPPWRWRELEWTGEGVVRVHHFGEPWSVWRWVSADGNWLPQQYVNLEDPWRPTPLGFDSGDWILDLVVDALGQWQYKDADELEWAERSGLVTPDWAARTREAGAKAVERIEAGGFGIDWDAIRPNIGWVLPTLPAGWDRVDEPGTGI